MFLMIGIEKSNNFEKFLTYHAELGSEYIYVLCGQRDLQQISLNQIFIMLIIKIAKSIFQNCLTTFLRKIYQKFDIMV